MTLPPAGMAPASRSRRAVIEAAGVGLVVVVAHLLLRLSGAFAVGALNDDGVYVALGKAIAEGDGYRSIYLAGAPLHLRYPPGFPLLLALPWALGGTLAAVRATVAALHPLVAGAAAGLVWWTGRRQLELAPASLALCAVAPFLLDPLIQYFNIPLTEPYLVLGWAGVLVLTPPLLDPPAADAVPWAGALAVGLLLAATTLFRAVGVALIPAVLLALAIQRGWKAAAVCAAAVVVPLLLWEALRAHWLARGPVSSQPDDLSYWRWLGVNGPLALAEYAGRTAFRNGVEYVRKLADYLFPIESVGIVVVLAAAAAAAAACVRMWRAAHPARPGPPRARGSEEGGPPAGGSPYPHPAAPCPPRRPRAGSAPRRSPSPAATWPDGSSPTASAWWCGRRRRPSWSATSSRSKPGAPTCCSATPPPRPSRFGCGATRGACASVCSP